MSTASAAMAEVYPPGQGDDTRAALAVLTACNPLVIDGGLVLDSRGRRLAGAQLCGSQPERTMLRWRGAVMAGPADVEVVVDGTPALRLIRRRVPGVALLRVLDGQNSTIGRVMDSAPMTDGVLRLRETGGLVGMMRLLGEAWELDLGGHPSSPGWMTSDGRDRLVLNFGWGARPPLAALALAYAVAAGTGLLAGGRNTEKATRSISGSVPPPPL